jgi:nicotinamide riboside kinase
MKIAITGSHGTGKTTLANAVSEILSLPLIDETARQIINTIPKNIDYRDGLSSDQRYLMQKTILQLQYFQESLFSNFVSDRASFDIKVYTELLTGQKIITEYNRYDLVVYVPIEFELKDDGVRFVDLEFQKQISQKMKDLIHKEIPKGKVLEVQGSVSQRLNQIIERVKSTNQS